MTNIFENIADYIKTTADNEPKPPMHVGEAYGCWLYVTALHEEIPAIEIGLNTTSDHELIELLQESKKLAESQLKKIEKLMIDEGVPLGITSEHKAKADSSSIPPGVKMSDYEIANYISLKVASNVVLATTNMTQSIRSDIGVMWLKLLTEKAQFGFKVKTVLRERGWLKTPPSYLPNGAGGKN